MVVVRQDKVAEISDIFAGILSVCTVEVTKVAFLPYSCPLPMKERSFSRSLIIHILPFLTLRRLNIRSFCSYLFKALRKTSSMKLQDVSLVIGVVGRNKVWSKRHGNSLFCLPLQPTFSYYISLTQCVTSVTSPAVLGCYLKSVPNDQTRFTFLLSSSFEEIS